MAKIARASTAQKPAKNLFSDLPGAASRRSAQARKLAPAERLGASKSDYSAHHIEVLEGLEPVRRRPGMYIGGTDEKALHHLLPR